jgi:hypothetical protein
MDPGIAAQDVHFQAGIIGKTIQTGPVVDVLGLLQRIGPEGVSGFGDIFGNAGLGGRDEFEPFAQNLLRLRSLPGLPVAKTIFIDTLSLNPSKILHFFLTLPRGTHFVPTAT